MSRPRLGIAGIGLIGGSIALRARTAHAHVIGFDRDPATVARAFARGAIDAQAPSLETLAAQCETLVIALPVDATANALDALAGVQGPALVLDVASVKGIFTRYAGRIANYVGTHPMAGRERGGIDAAEAQLFEHASWAHVPHADDVLIARVRAFIIAMGATPLQIEAQRHDAIVALTSHLPQSLSVVLGARLADAARGDAQVTELCGPGILSMLRLARSPEATWGPIVEANAGWIAEQLRSVAHDLDTVARALEAGDSRPLLANFAPARQAANALADRFPQPAARLAHPG